MNYWRHILSTIIFFLITQLIVAKPPIKPVKKKHQEFFVLQGHSIEKLVEKYWKIAARFESADIQQKNQELFKDFFHKNGYSGLDTKKPLAMRIDLNTDTPDKAHLFFAVGITDEEKAIDLFNHIGPMDELSAVAIENEKKLYKLVMSRLPEVNTNSYVRTFDKQLHLGLNTDQDSMAIDKLIDYYSLIDTENQSHLSLNIDYKNTPENFRKGHMHFFGILTGGVDYSKPHGVVINSLLSHISTMIKDGEYSNYQLNLADDNRWLTFESKTKALPQTSLMSELETLKTTPSPFAGIASKNSIAQFNIHVDPYSVQVTKLFCEALKKIVDDNKKEAPEAAHALIDKAVPLVIKTLRNRDLHIAASFHGPDEKGNNSLVASVSVQQADTLLGDVRKLVDQFAEGAVEWDADKAGEVSIHCITVAALLPPNVTKKIFNKVPKIHFALTPKGIIFAMGSNNIEEIRRIIDLKPGEVDAVNAVINPAKTAEIAAKFDEKHTKRFVKLFGKKDEPAPLLSWKIQAGRQSPGLSAKAIPDPGTDFRSTLKMNLDMISMATGFPE